MKEMEQKVKVEPKQKRSVATKQKIKAAAKKLFAEQGYYKVTSNNIAVAAKVPIGSFYNYFGNKKGLILELIRDFNEEFHTATFGPEDIMPEKLTSKEEVLQVIELLLKRSFLASNLSDPFYRIIHALQFTEPDILALSEESRVKEMEVISQILEKIHEFHPIANIPITAKMLHATAENVALYIHHLGSNFEREQLIEESTKMLFAYLFVKL